MAAESETPGLGFHDLALAFCCSLCPQVLSVAIPRAEHTVPDICGPFLAQADAAVWGLAMGPLFIQSLSSYNLTPSSGKCPQTSSHPHQLSQGTKPKQSPLPHPYTQQLTQFC